MSKKTTGGSAFPSGESYVLTDLAGNEEKHQKGALHNGMTLRDYLAAKSLALGGEFFHGFGNGCDTAETIAGAAYYIADAMLAERAK